MFYTVHGHCIYILLYICVIIFLFSPFDGVEIVLDKEIKNGSFVAVCCVAMSVNT